MSLVINAFAVSWGISKVTVLNQRLLRETKSRPITSIVRQCQLWLYEYVARYPEADPAFQVVSERDNPGWRRLRERPQSSWLGQVNASCWELLDVGRWVHGDLHGMASEGWQDNTPLGVCP